jgi:CRP/FNR family cyclic AMP-dependent transcriptional regulator
MRLCKNLTTLWKPVRKTAKFRKNNTRTTTLWRRRMNGAIVTGLCSPVKGYDAREFIAELRHMEITPHIAQNDTNVTAQASPVTSTPAPGSVLSKRFGAGMTVQNYRDKEAVFSQGDTADSVFYIESGTVKLTVVSARKKAIIAILQRGSFFGEGCLAGQSLRICTARSIGQSNITRLQKQSTVRALRRDPQFATLFGGYLLSRVVRIEEDLIDQFFNFSERRLARVLLLFGQITKESKPEFPLKVSQATLAEMVGTTRSRVSKFMNRFKKKGMVSYNGGLQINSALVIGFLQSRPMSVKKA